MRRWLRLVTVGMVALLVVASGVAQADEIFHPVGTKLLVREYNMPVTFIPAAPGASEASLPASFDWGPLARNPFGRTITDPARNQLSCGSCWAFASVAVLEAWVNATYGFTVDLSEEMLVSDCCPAGDCNGGYLNQAADWMVGTGTTTEECFPYTATNGPCSGFCPDPIMGRTESWAYACGNWWTIDIEAIKQALVNHGPLVTGMDVYQDFDAYAGGVYRHSWGSYRGGHAVLLTGYVDDPQQPGGGYFIAKNSWGPDFGPYGGYFAVAYDSNCDFGIESTYYHRIIVY